MKLNSNFVGTVRCDVRDGQRRVGPSLRAGDSETPSLRCVSVTAQRSVPTTSLVGTLRRGVSGAQRSAGARVLSNIAPQRMCQSSRRRLVNRKSRCKSQI
jgi:hypothetical protein